MSTHDKLLAKLGNPNAAFTWSERVGHDLHLAANVAAQRAQMSLNELTKNALERYLAQA